MIKTLKLPIFEPGLKVGKLTKRLEALLIFLEKVDPQLRVKTKIGEDGDLICELEVRKGDLR